jgi:predicted DNA-binding transcriptional regulator YafY
MDLFNRSLQQKEKIMIFYIDNSNNVTQRVIRVITIYDNAVVAFCYYRKQVRTFKLNNILSVGTIDKRVGA